jgi:hypothetical protein
LLAVLALSVGIAMAAADEAEEARRQADVSRKRGEWVIATQHWKSYLWRQREGDVDLWFALAEYQEGLCSVSFGVLSAVSIPWREGDDPAGQKWTPEFGQCRKWNRPKFQAAKSRSAWSK